MPLRIPEDLYQKEEAFNRVVKYLNENHETQLKPITGDTKLTEHHLFFARDIIGWVFDITRDSGNQVEAILKFLFLTRDILNRLKDETCFENCVEKISNHAVTTLLVNPNDEQSKCEANIVVNMVNLANLMIPDKKKPTGKFTDKLNPSVRSYLQKNILLAYSGRHKPDTVSFDQYAKVGAKVVEVVLDDAITQVRTYEQKISGSVSKPNDASPSPS